MESERRRRYRMRCGHFRDDMCLRLSEGLAIEVGCFGECGRMKEYDRKNGRETEKKRV